MKIEPRLRYPDGTGCWQGDKATVIATGERVYVRVIGVNGFVTVLPGGPGAAAYVVNVSELRPGHDD